MAGYGDDSGFATWLTEQGYALPVGSPSAAILRQRGATYIDGTYARRFTGRPTGGYAQERAWPRTGAYAFCDAIGDSVIPDAVIKASYEAAYQEAMDPGSLSAIGSAADAVKREKVGKIEVEYHTSSAEGVAGSLVPIITGIEGLLAPFLSPVGGFPSILVV